MNFLSLLQSLEELLYEVMTWLLFYPRTMWRAVRDPIAMLRYSEREVRESPDDQFEDTVSPPLFLLLTVLLSHAIELASHQHLSAPTTDIGKEIASSPQNLLILRAVLFAIYPLMFAAARLRLQKAAVTRQSLRQPFFAQCFVAAPSAFAIGIAAILARSHYVAIQGAAILLFLASAVWFLWAETRWFKSHAHISGFAAVRLSIWTWLKASVLNSLLSAAILGLDAS